MEESPNPNVGLEPEAAPPSVDVAAENTPEIPPAPPPSTSSGLLTVGILLAAVSLGIVWIKQDSDKAAARQKAAATQDSKADGPSPIKIGAPAPKLVLKDLQGHVVNLEDLKGKVVIVDFWATWCEPCQIMIPWLEEFHTRYASSGLEIVGVSMDDDIKDVIPFADKAKMNYPVVFGNDSVADSWGGVFGLPTSFMIDRQGKIRATHQGLIGKDVIEKDIRSML
jgi:thiol-disulfide isomerase/thioredoxin